MTARITRSLGNQGGFSNPGSLAGLTIALLITGAVLTWLFVQADSISSGDHQGYQRELRLLRQADTELDTAILAARYGLSASYDGIVARTDALAESIGVMQAPPDYILGADREALRADIDDYARLHAEKTDLVESFKRENAVVRNSLAYFPGLREVTQAAVALDPEVDDLVRRYSCQVMSHAVSEDVELGNAAITVSERLEAQLARLDEDSLQLVTSLLAHGRVIVIDKPRLGQITAGILSLGTGAQAERIHSSYARGHANALQRAERYHLALYVTALLLAAYIALIIIRLARTSSALDGANRELGNRLETLLDAQANLRLLSTVFTNASEGMVITDAKARILAANPAFTQITGYPLDEVLGQTPALLRSGEHDETFYRTMWSTLSNTGEWHGEIWNRRRDGSVYPEWLSITAARDAGGGVSHYIGVFSDMSERKEAEARIRFLAHHDTLTGLPNRVLMQDRLNQALRNARRARHHVAAMCLDLDRFKNINDTLGPETGDQLIIQVAERCRNALRETDTLSRQAGDEFIIVLPELDQPEDAANAARKLLATFDRPFRLGDHELAVNASIGIAVHPGDGSSPAQLVKHADIAMYRAKERGRARYEFYAEDVNAASLGKLLLENHLRRAVAASELVLHYQPKFSADRSRLTGFEALLRWVHPEHGLLAPGAFLQVAEEAGLMSEIGSWAIDQVCAQQARWRDDGRRNVPVAVNLAAQQFEQQDIAGLVRDSLAAHELGPDMLELELTETALMRDPDHAGDVLRRLHAMGVTLAIDDFGTGYASLSYLHLFPVQTVKIDQSFVAPLGTHRNEGKIASAIIALAHSLGMKVVAEGVETEEQQSLLLAQGCDQIQGFLCGRPIPPDEASALLANRD